MDIRNRYYFPIHQLIDFCNPYWMCLLRGTSWIFTFHVNIRLYTFNGYGLQIVLKILTNTWRVFLVPLSLASFSAVRSSRYIASLPQLCDFFFFLYVRYSPPVIVTLCVHWTAYRDRTQNKIVFTKVRPASCHVCVILSLPRCRVSLWLWYVLGNVTISNCVCGFFGYFSESF